MLDNQILLNATCFPPGARTHANSIYNIERLVKLVPHVIPESDVSQVKDEQRLYVVATEGNWKRANGCKRFDHYRSAVFEIETASGGVKYTKPQPVVKAILSFSNGNAAVERSLFDNKNTVTCERSKLMEETIVGLRLMKEYARKHSGVHDAPISKWIIDSMKKVEHLNDAPLKEEMKKHKLSNADKEKAD